MSILLNLLKNGGKLLEFSNLCWLDTVSEATLDPFTTKNINRESDIYISFLQWGQPV